MKSPSKEWIEYYSDDNFNPCILYYIEVPGGRLYRYYSPAKGEPATLAFAPSKEN